MSNQVNDLSRRISLLTARHTAPLAFLVAAAASALVWVLSPWLTGHAEPWDTGGLYYVTALFVAGLISGSLVPRALWVHYLGAVVSQVVYEALFLEMGKLSLLGLGFLLGYSLVFLLAAALAGFLRLRFSPQPPTA